jgi:hypothetical protein
MIYSTSQHDEQQWGLASSCLRALGAGNGILKSG